MRRYFFLFLFTFMWCVEAFAQTQQIHEINIDANLKTNGELEVVEQWAISANKGSYWEYSLDVGEFSNVVLDAETVGLKEKGGGNYTISWHSMTEGKHLKTIKYTITGFAKIYKDDAVGFKHEFASISADFVIPKFKLRIVCPSKLKNDSYQKISVRGFNGVLEIDRKSILVNNTVPIGIGQSVNVAAELDKRMLPRANKTPEFFVNDVRLDKSSEYSKIAEVFAAVAFLIIFIIATIWLIRLATAISTKTLKISRLRKTVSQQRLPPLNGDWGLIYIVAKTGGLSTDINPIIAWHIFQWSKEGLITISWPYIIFHATIENQLYHELNKMSNPSGCLNLYSIADSGTLFFDWQFDYEELKYQYAENLGLTSKNKFLQTRLTSDGVRALEEIIGYQSFIYESNKISVDTLFLSALTEMGIEEPAISVDTEIQLFLDLLDVTFICSKFETSLFEGLMSK